MIELVKNKSRWIMMQEQILQMICFIVEFFSFKKAELFRHVKLQLLSEL